MSAITPKKVALSTDENIAGIKIYKCDSDQEGEDYSAPVFARDGDFGFPCIDGTGQVNFSPSLADGYDAVEVSGDTSKFKNFKTPYTTCKNNLFRITKVSDDASVSLSAVKESEMEGYSITYKIVIPENYTGPLPVVTEYRTNDAMLSSYSPKVLEFVDKQVISKSYSKDTGYPDKSVSDAAQVNFTVD